MRSTGLLTLAALAAVTLAPAAAPDPGNPVEVLDTPGGRPVAILLSGAQPRVIEQREGYARISLEGWVRAPGTADSAPPSEPAPAPAPVPPPAAPLSSATGSVSGSILVTLPSGETRKGAGARVVLLGQLAELEVARREAAAAYRPAAQKIEEEIARLDAQRRAALNSSDNLGQATQTLDRTKKDLAARQKDFASLKATSTAREGVLVDKYAVQAVHAGEDGSFRFAGVPPGEYRLWAIVPGSDATEFRWYLPARVEAGADTVLDLTSRKPGEDPFLTNP